MLRAGIVILVRGFTKDVQASGAASPSQPEPTHAERLLRIYQIYPSGYLPPLAVSEVRGIGESIDRIGGISLMRSVHSEFESLCLRNGLIGAPRNLEHTWNQVGTWRG